MTKSFAKELELCCKYIAKWNAAIEFCKDNSLGTNYNRGHSMESQ